MSLNGLDDPKVKEAHDAAVSEPGGWYELFFTSDINIVSSPVSSRSRAQFAYPDIRIVVLLSIAYS